MRCHAPSVASVFVPSLVTIGSLAASSLRCVCALARFSAHGERSRASSLRSAGSRLAGCERPSLCGARWRRAGLVAVGGGPGFGVVAASVAAGSVLALALCFEEHRGQAKQSIFSYVTVWGSKPLCPNHAFNRTRRYGPSTWRT